MAAPVRITVPAPITTGSGLKATTINLPQIQAAQAAQARQQEQTRKRERRAEDPEERRRRRRALTRAATVLTAQDERGGTGRTTVLGVR